ncbi:TPA: YebC/PmpR family DNA-binding transcriptional regulator [Candidatus Saccharibacteria bacterium]|nr:YebC/PmpR family DNA-binding transcriptional regulator [Candidatus Saccharibacteria bacterium]HIO87967.1 YebC/PmpR family DNA-binding transcriptional regulator [Candidatus Saccharibacteria bacterium]
MAGHSKWAKIKRDKGANDAKRGAIFTKLGNGIAIAVKSGGKDPDMNPTLALAIEKAKQSNMPNANIERAIKRGAGELGGAQVEEVMYEGYGPAGVAVLIECATDNTNRTLTFVKTAFTKNGGNLAESGAVSYLFDRKGVITIKKTGDDDSDQLTAIEAGASDIADSDDSWIVYTELQDLGKVRDTLKSEGFTVTDATASYEPKATMLIDDEEKQQKVMKLMDALDELDDVVETYTNFDIA